MSMLFLDRALIPALPLISRPTSLSGADASVVRRTQARFQAAGQPTVHFTARFLLASRYYAYLTAVVGLTMASLSKYAWGRSLMLRLGDAA